MIVASAEDSQWWQLSEQLLIRMDRAVDWVKSSERLRSSAQVEEAALILRKKARFVGRKKVWTDENPSSLIQKRSTRPSPKHRKKLNQLKSTRKVVRVRLRHRCRKMRRRKISQFCPELWKAVRSYEQVLKRIFRLPNLRWLHRFHTAHKS